jgi:methionyl-tRNA synthetase
MDTIEYEEFAKVDLKVGKVISAEKVPKSHSLLKLMVDVGEESPRQILSGISAWYTPEELEGRWIIVCLNLKPRKMMGIESQGMLLAADVDETAVLLKPDEKLDSKLKPGVPIA